MAKQAFDAKRGTFFNFDPFKLIIAGLDKGDKTHPYYDPRVELPLDEAMVLNIMEYGVTQPINVVKDGDDAWVLAGRRRVLHAREACRRLKKGGMKPILVPAVQKRGDEKRMLGIFVSENEIREDDSITAKAAKAQRLIDAGYTVEEIATTVYGVSQTAVKGWLKVLDCDTKVRKAVDEGAISASAAAKLADLPREEQRSHLEEMVATGTTSTAEAARRTRNARSGAAPEEATQLKPKVRLVKKVLELAADEENPNGLDPQFVRGIKFMLGELDPASVKGLKALMREATPKKREPKAKKEAKSSKPQASKEPKPPRTAPKKKSAPPRAPRSTTKKGTSSRRAI